MWNHAAYALGQIGDKRAVEPLIEALKEKVYRAAEALGEFGRDERVAKALVQALKAVEEDNVYFLLSSSASYSLRNYSYLEYVNKALKEYKNYIKLRFYT